MEGMFFAARDGVGMHYLEIKLDSQALEYLAQGLPIECGVFVDSNTHLPDHARGIMKISFGTKIDLDKKSYKNKIARDVIFSKIHLLNSFRNIQNEIIKAFGRDLVINGKKVEPVPLSNEVPFLGKPRKLLTTPEVAALLELRITQMFSLRKKKHLTYAVDNRYDAEVIHKIKEEQPQWLQQAKQLAKMGRE